VVGRALSATPDAVDILLDEPVDRREERVQWPVTVGVPFANGSIRLDTPFALSGQSGVEAVQTDPLVEWRTGARTPKWVLLDFQASFGRGLSPTFRLRPGVVSRAPLVHAIRVHETENAIGVDTGAVSFSVSRSEFSLVSAFRGRSWPCISESSIYWIDAEGQRYETKNYSEPEVVVEKAGPLRAVIRAEGWYAAEGEVAGEAMMRYQVRIAAFAGLPYVRVCHTLIWTPGDEVVMRDFGLTFRFSEKASKGRVGIVGASAHESELGCVEAVQREHRSATLLTSDGNLEAAQLSGWAAAGGLAVALQDLNMQTPKAFTITPEELTLHLWAPQVGPMSMKAEERIVQSWKNWLPRQEWHKFNKVSPQGVAKTHEIWLWPLEPDSPSPEAVNDLVQRPPVACADPVYMATTDAIPGLRAASRTPGKWQFVEQALDAMYRHVTHRYEAFENYNLWNFGDVHLFSFHGWRSWDGGGYNWPAIAWMLFYRTGNRFHLQNGMRNARHVMDVDCCHHAPLKAKAHTKGLGFMHMYSGLHWGWGPIWDNFHTHPEYLLYCYCLTGYERARDVLELMAESARANLGAPDPQDWLVKRKAIVSRTQYGQIMPKAVYYELTGDPYFLENAKAWTDLALAARKEDGSFSNNNFMGFFYTGLDRVWRLTGDRRVGDAVVGLLREFHEVSKTPADAPAWDRRNLTAFATAARVTKNDSFLRYAIPRIVRQARVVETGPIDPKTNGGLGYCSLSRILYPVFMEGSMNCLGAWADLGFPDYPAWPRNSVFFASRPDEKVGAFESGVTLVFRKEQGQGGAVILKFKEANLGEKEQFKGHRLEARLSGPGGLRRTVPIEPRNGEWYGRPVVYGPDPVHIGFSAGDPAGQYGLQVLSTQRLFWMTPRTELPGMVVWRPNADVRYITRLEPAKMFFRLTPGADSVTLEKVGAVGGMARPMTLVDPDGSPLAYFAIDGAKQLAVKVAPKLRKRPLALVKGQMRYGVYTYDLAGVRIRNAYPYIALHPDQWFLPE